jgi:putative ABC transport system permease protein
MGRSERFFRALLRLFPREFRGDFADDMAATFNDQRRDVLAQGDRMGALKLWIDTIRGVLTTAPREHLDVLRGDAKYALRNLRRNPGFTAVAVVALAVGTGANTAVFTIVNGVLLRSLPYKDPDALVTMFEKIEGAPVDHFSFSAPDFEIVRSLARSYSGMAAYRRQSYELSGTMQPERIVGTRVSPEIFDVLGVAPAFGRSLTQDDDRTNAKVAVLNYGLWTRAFGRDPAIVGKTIVLDGETYAVVGVMPDSFTFPPRGGQAFSGEPADVYTPIAFSPIERAAFGSMYNNNVVARLKPGVAVAQARAELGSIVPTLAERYPPVLTRMARTLTLPMWPFADEVVGSRRQLILVLMGAVAMVLLIGCADVANLMLTRAGSRQREIAVRSALGASGPRVVRQLLTEGFVLASLGAAAGLALAYWTLQALLSMAGDVLPRGESIRFDGRIVAFAAALALVTPLIFGVMPAIRTALQSTFDALKEGTRAATPGRARHRLLAAFVIAQFALALVLSVGAGLLVRSFVRLLATDPGFRAEHAVTAVVTLPVGRYAAAPQVKAFYQQAVESVRALPGISAAGASTDRALNVLERRVFSADASAVQLPSTSRTIAASWVVGNYFEAMGIPLKRGRFFTDGDGRYAPGARQVVIVSDMLAKRLWPDQDPIGRQIKWGIDAAVSPAPWMTVVGVVGDMKQDALGTETVPMTYEPIYQEPNGAARFYRTVNVVARTSGDTNAAIAAVRGALQRIDPALPVTKAQALDTVVTDSIKPQRFSMSVVAGFALVALGLAAIGIYGVLANVVSQQTHEIGVRMALGATASSVVWSVLRRSAILMAIGVAIGTAGAVAITRVMAGLLYEVRPTDAVSYAGAVAVLALLSLAASLVPAWRATRVDPLIALRTE